MVTPESTALIVIDMQEGFVDHRSPLCISGAAATVPACVRALAAARQLGLTVVHVVRSYDTSGSNVELTRYEQWRELRPLSPAAAPGCSARVVNGLEPLDGELVVVKPRFSAFFATGLHEELRGRGIGTVVLMGTTTPNCIRSSAYDALSLDYNVAVLEDCTSSRSDEVQRANLADLRCVGVQVLGSRELEERGVEGIVDLRV